MVLTVTLLLMPVALAELPNLSLILPRAAVSLTKTEVERLLSAHSPQAVNLKKVANLILALFLLVMILLFPNVATL